LRTSEICIAAVLQNRKALNYVPEVLKVQVKKGACT